MSLNFDYSNEILQHCRSRIQNNPGVQNFRSTSDNTKKNFHKEKRYRILLYWFLREKKNEFGKKITTDQFKGYQKSKSSWIDKPRYLSCINMYCIINTVSSTLDILCNREISFLLLNKSKSQSTFCNAKIRQIEHILLLTTVQCLYFVYICKIVIIVEQNSAAVTYQEELAQYLRKFLMPLLFLRHSVFACKINGQFFSNEYTSFTRWSKKFTK